ncbi:hypothetical protein, partial [Azotobacter beijerinckii]|uniref:hypothetical protein n=1 Tax=Azotobacter beijerinckii TaxID=170623 RepID=UPI001B8B7AA3
LDASGVVDPGVWGATEQKVHLSPVPARKPLWRLVSSEKPPFCRTRPGASSLPEKGGGSRAENPFVKSKS